MQTKPNIDKICEKNSTLFAVKTSDKVANKIAETLNIKNDRLMAICVT